LEGISPTHSRPLKKQRINLNKELITRMSSQSELDDTGSLNDPESIGTEIFESRSKVNPFTRLSLDDMDYEVNEEGNNIFSIVDKLSTQKTGKKRKLNLDQ